MEKTSYLPGTFSWVDLATSDVAAAKKFYGDLFGWSARDIEHEGTLVYSMFEMNGKHVAGMGELQPEQKQANIPPHWMNYVSVASAADTAKKVEAAGGKVVVPPMEVFDSGTMAVFVDPVGAMISVWQPKQHIGAQVVNETGSMCWNELYSPDAAISKQFYSAVFGWTFDEMQMPDGTYNTINNGENSNGGILEMKGEQWAGVPPHWAVYFTVADCDASTAKIKELGGTVLHGPHDIPDIGRFAVCCDAQGAHFCIIKLAGNMAE